MAFRTNKTPVLQEKTASGAVATFNTALAMPLVSCNVAVNAWQEGSGDPSPSNVRPIHGFSMLNATRVGKNLLNKDNFIILYTPYSEMTFSKATFLKKGTYTISLSNVVNATRWRYAFRLFDKNGNIFTNAITNGKVSFSLDLADTYSNNTTCVSTTNIYDTSCVITIYEDCYITCGLCFGNVSSTTTCNPQIEHNNTATDYESYVTPTIYTIQLGQEVYGAEVDVVNGVAHCTWIKQSMDVRWIYSSDNNGYFVINPVSQVPSKARGITNIICDCYKTTESTTITNMPDLAIKGAANSSSIIVRDNSFGGNANDFIDYVKNHYIVYELAEPFDIQLTPTQIETLIGDNTIFADTGDVSLVYNDLDIAKRGSFREVFKLP